MDFFPENLYKLLRYYYKMKLPFPLTLAKIYSYQIIRGLVYLNAKGICHRDLKPQNILISTSDQKLVICDFGSAKIMEKYHPSTSYICSRYYRAPELLLGQKHYGHKVDMWSAGCVIGEMFMKRPIFPGKST